MGEPVLSTNQRFPILGEREAGAVQHHMVALPGAALTEQLWPVITVTGRQEGPTVLVTAGVHGCEYPAIESAIRLGTVVNPDDLAGSIVIVPVVNLPGFWERSMFVCPVDGLNPNRMFPGDPDGSYTEQLAYAITNEFIVHADYYIDLHGGDMVEALVPFSICRGGEIAVDLKSRELATVFGLENLLIIDKPVQPAKGDMTFVAAAQRGVPGFIAEAGAVGQLDEHSVQLLLDGITRVLNHLGMTDLAVSTAAIPNAFTQFEWVYSNSPGMFYAAVSVGECVRTGQPLGRIGSLHGNELERIASPVSGQVMFLTTSPAVREQGLLMGIGRSS